MINGFKSFHIHYFKFRVVVFEVSHVRVTMYTYKTTKGFLNFFISACDQEINLITNSQGGTSNNNIHGIFM